MKIVKILALLIVLPQVSAAFTLEALQLAALENRALVKQFEAEVDKAAESVRIARSEYYPSLDLLYRTYTIDEATPTERRENSIFTTALSWNLFSGFKDKYSISSAESLRDVESFQLRAIEQDVQLAVALRYLAVFNQQAILKVARDTFKNLEGLYLDSKNRYEVGLIDKNTVLKFKVDYDNARLGVKREEADLAKTLNDLSKTVNLQISEDELAFDEFQTTPPLEDQNRLEEMMLATRSELKALESFVESATYTVSAEYGDYYPQFDLVGSYRRSDDSLLTGQGEFTDEELRAELILSFNLFNGFEDEADIARAKSAVRSVQYDLAELRNDLKTTLKNIVVDYQISLENVEVAREDIISAEENLRITDLKYKEGVQRQIDLLDAVSNLTRAQSNYVAVVRTVFENYFRVIRMIEGFPGRT